MLNGMNTVSIQKRWSYVVDYIKYDNKLCIHVSFDLAEFIGLFLGRASLFNHGEHTGMGCKLERFG